jgi:hypothetical protein
MQVTKRFGEDIEKSGAKAGRFMRNPAKCSEIRGRYRVIY